MPGQFYIHDLIWFPQPALEESVLNAIWKLTHLWASCFRAMKMSVAKPPFRWASQGVWELLLASCVFEISSRTLQQPFISGGSTDRNRLRFCLRQTVKSQSQGPICECTSSPEDFTELTLYLANAGSSFGKRPLKLATPTPPSKSGISSGVL